MSEYSDVYLRMLISKRWTFCSMLSNKKKKEKSQMLLKMFSKKIEFSAATALFTMVKSKGVTIFNLKKRGIKIFDFTIVNRAVSAENSIFLLSIFSSIWLFSFFFVYLYCIVFACTFAHLHNAFGKVFVHST